MNIGTSISEILVFMDKISMRFPNVIHGLQTSGRTCNVISGSSPCFYNHPICLSINLCNCTIEQYCHHVKVSPFIMQMRGLAYAYIISMIGKSLGFRLCFISLSYLIAIDNVIYIRWKKHCRPFYLLIAIKL